MAAFFEALYGRICRSPNGWFKLSEVDMFGKNFVYQAMKKVKVIWDRLKAAQSRKKSYVNIRHRDLEFEVGDRVFLKVYPMKGAMRFGKMRSLVPGMFALIWF